MLFGGVMHAKVQHPARVLAIVAGSKVSTSWKCCRRWSARRKVIVGRHRQHIHSSRGTASASRGGNAARYAKQICHEKARATPDATAWGPTAFAALRGQIKRLEEVGADYMIPISARTPREPMPR